MSNGNLPTDTPYDAANSASTGRVLGEDAGREMAAQTRSNFAADIGISGLQIQLKNGQSSPAIIGTATIPTASQSAAGAMTSADKAKLDGVAAGANNYVLPSAGRETLGGVKTTSGVTSAAGYTPSPIIDGVPYYKDTTYGDFKGATASAAGSRGLVPAPAMGAPTRYLRSDGTWQVPPYPTVDPALSSTSTNPVQNKAVSAELGKKAPLASPNLTGSPTAPTPASGSNNTQLATTAFVQNAVNAAVTNAAAYQGAANSYTEITKTAYKPGWYWFVRTAGEYAGQQCESGDMVIANKAKGNSVSDSDFDVIQSNVDYVSANDVKVWFA